MRFIFNVGIKVIGLVLLIIMLLQQSRYIPYLIVVIGAFFAMYRPSAKRTRGESGNPAEVAACHGGYPKARTKLERNRLVTDEGSTLDTKL